MDTRKQIAERLGTANNVLVTVSANPTVDQLAACIGLTLALNKLGKHSTAVFSGDVPDTIDFLKPDQTLEKSADSLRDFIIALDKAKADKLRYKVEDKVVKIFITPYRTSLTSDDLMFSQGDFNVDVVMALGVAEQRDLDQAITAHGRILHDATVVSLNTAGSSELGSLNWTDSNASCLSEMVTILLKDLGKKTLDNQIATALLTGVVAETDRFRNQRTTARSLSVSSDLMSAGANQQLITSQLDHEIDVRQSSQPPAQPSPSGADEQPDAAGTLNVEHDGEDTAEQPATVEELPPPPEPPQLPPTAPTGDLPKVHRVRALPDQNAGDSYDYDEELDAGENDKPLIDSNQKPSKTAQRPLLSHDKPVATEQPKPTEPPEPTPATLDVPAQPKPPATPAKPANTPLPTPAPSPAEADQEPDMWSAPQSFGPAPSAAGPLPPPDLPPPPAPEPPKPMAPPTPPVPPAEPVSPTPNLTESPVDKPAPPPSPTAEPAKAEPEVKDYSNDVEAARSEVMRALSEQSDDRPEPLQALNAQSLGSNLHTQPESAPSTPSAPPMPPAQPSQSTPSAQPPLTPSPVGPPPTPAATPMDMPLPGGAGSAPASAPSQPFGQPTGPTPPMSQRPGATPPPPVPPPMLPPTQR